MMGEYNKTYLEYQSKLNLLKFIEKSKQNPSEVKLKKLDELLKLLDEAYSENRPVSMFQNDIQKLEE